MGLAMWRLLQHPLPSCAIQGRNIRADSQVARNGTMQNKGMKGKACRCTISFGTAAATAHPDQTRTHPMVELHVQAADRLSKTLEPSLKQWNSHCNVPQSAQGTERKSVSHAFIFPSPKAAV